MAFEAVLAALVALAYVEAGRCYLKAILPAGDDPDAALFDAPGTFSFRAARAVALLATVLAWPLFALAGLSGYFRG